MPSNKQVTLKLRKPNPLFVKWVSEWLKFAKEHNLRTTNVFEKALNSLKKYPLPLDEAKDCIILEGFGPLICQLLEKKYTEHKKKLLNGSVKISSPKNIIKIKEKIVSKRKPLSVEHVSPKKKRKTPKSIPEENKEVVQETNAVVMSPNTFDVILLVDVQEISGKNKRIMDATITGLTKQKINFEVRKLNVGDFTWICRNKEGIEVVLPYIVERKRMDDFGSSIKDGRFHEQKFRLKQSGIQNLIYLIESYGNNQYAGLPIQTLFQAATNTQVQENFSVKFTDGHDESMLYLSVMTELLTNKYKEKVLISCEKVDIASVKSTDTFIPVMKFDEFYKLSSKTRDYKAREIFVKQLVQLKLLSVDKALAITNIYATPKLLITAYKNCLDVDEGQQLLANIRFGPINRPIGPNISKTLYQFYMS